MEEAYMKITFLDAATLGDDLIRRIPELFGRFGEVVIRNSTATTEVEAAISDSEVVVVNKIKLNSSNLKNAESLRLICEAATGFDNIDTEFCSAAGIAVCNVKAYSTHSVAQLTLALAMTLMCHIPQYTDYVECGAYTDSGIANMLSPVYHEICGRVWGIVGAGNIGMQVAKVAEAMGCRVIVNKRHPVSDMECTDIDTLCKTADIISVHTPLTDETQNLINRERIAMMKPDAIFINVARGAVADEAALTEAIEQNRLGGLGIDVYSEEPFAASHPYNRILNHPNTCFTPHIAWGAYEARLRCLKTTADNIDAFLSGKTIGRIDI